MTFSKWRHRFDHQGMGGLREEQRPGRPRSHDEQGVAEVLNRALESASPWPPLECPQPVPAQRHFQVHCPSVVSVVQAAAPDGHGHFKILNDPFFMEKVNDIVGLYLRALDHVVVLCVDEKTQIQSL